MINNFKFFNPTKIYFGEGCLSNIESEIKSFKNVLVLYEGEITKKIGVLQKVYNELNKIDIKITELSGVMPNPDKAFCEEGAELANRENIDLIISVGGGSVIDTAKAIAILANNIGDDIFDYIDGNKTPQNDPISHFAVLTSAATSTENSPAAVISDNSKNRKATYFSETAFPNVAFCDPTFTFSLPKFQTASGAFDIYSHVIEQYMSLETFDAMEYPHLNILKTLVKWVPKALSNSNDYEARSNIMWSSTLALNGHGYVGKSPGWYAHGLSYPITSYFKIPHGASLAITMPYFIEYALNHGNNTVVFKRKIEQISEITFGHKDTNKFISDLKKMITDWGLNYKISNYKNFKYDNELLNKISDEGFLGHSNESFINTNKEVAKEIYEKIFKDK